MKKFFLLCFVGFFIVMMIGGVSASHTYHKGGYTFKVSDEVYDKIQRLKNGDKSVDLGEIIKTKHYKKMKVPIYKEKKVTRYKMVYKKVKVYWADEIFDDSKVYKVPKKYKSWKYVGKDSKFTGNGRYFHMYYVFKKFVPYKVKEDVKVGSKKVKLRVYALVDESSYEPYVTFYAGNPGKGVSYNVHDFKRYSL